MLWIRPLSQESQSAQQDAPSAGSWLPGIALLLAGIGAAMPARADVNLRVEARPINDPIEVYVTVNDANGAPTGGLTAGDFTVSLDGVPLTLQPTDFALPPAQDSNRRVSVVFAMDYSPSVTNTALGAMQDSVIAFIDAMQVGDYAAIVKFNDTNPSRASVILPFTQVDQGAGNLALESAVLDAYPGSGTNMYDAIAVSMDQFLLPPSALPAGPKAIILITDGGENSSTATASDVLAVANDNSIPVFVIGVGHVTGKKRLTQLTDQTGGEYLPAPDAAEIAAAYAVISLKLSNEYLLTITAAAVTDCGQHALQVAVAGQPASATAVFGRCDTTPDPFSFESKDKVALNALVTSRAVTISGITGPTEIDVADGEYSIGCGSATFRADSSMVNNGDTVCVRHSAAPAYGTATVTTLTVGGVSGTFKSTTMDEPPAGGGGGGTTGALDLLLGLAALVARRRIRT